MKKSPAAPSLKITRSRNNLLFDAVKMLDGAGMKKTRFRKELLIVFLEAQSPLSAAQIESALQAKGVRVTGAFDRATLYRNLSSLAENEILNSSDFGTGAGFFTLRKVDRHEHYVFCTECETAEPIKYCGVAPMVEEASSRGYRVKSHRLELLGVCPECQ